MTSLRSVWLKQSEFRVRSVRASFKPIQSGGRDYTRTDYGQLDDH